MALSASRRSSVVLCLALFTVTINLGGILTGCAGSSSNSSGTGTTTPITPTPAITAISPTKAPAGSTALTLTITGSGFTNISTVQVGGVTESSAYVSATQITATIPASQLLSGSELPVVVLNGTLSSGGIAVNLEIDNPAPVISSLSTTTALAGTASAIITFTGTGFVPSTVINVNGSARTTTYINSTQVSAALPSTDFAAAGTLSFTAVNPAPG